MFGDGSLTFQEFAMRESLPLATIHDAVLEFLRGRDDAVLYGAQAVNAYVYEPRMTQSSNPTLPRFASAWRRPAPRRPFFAPGNRSLPRTSRAKRTTRGSERPATRVRDWCVASFR